MTNLVNWNIDDEKSETGLFAISFVDNKLSIRVSSSSLVSSIELVFDHLQLLELKEFLSDSDIRFWKFNFADVFIFKGLYPIILSLQRCDSRIVVHVSICSKCGMRLETDITDYIQPFRDLFDSV